MAVKIVYHGHSNLEIQSGDSRIQIDPYFTGNGLADVPAVAVNPTHIFLSHAHGDHYGDTVAIAKRTGATVVANFEMSNYLKAQGIENLRPMNHGGCATFPFGRVSMTIAFHSSTFPDGAYGGEPAGWVFETGGKTIYFAGDTALFGDMKLIGELWKIDLACLPIGDNFTMGPAHAVKAAALLGAKLVLPIHYNTFPPIKQDVHRFAADLLKETGFRALPMKAGETFDL